MFLILFTVFYLAYGKIMQANLTFFEKIADNEYQLDIPHVVLFMVPFGAKYASLKQIWEQQAKLKQNQFQFVEVDCYEDPEVQQLFQMIHYPQIMYIDESGHFYMDQSLVLFKLFYADVLSYAYINNFLKGEWRQIEKRKIFKISWSIRIKNYLFNYIVQDAIMGIGIIFLMVIAINIRMNIYRDDDEKILSTVENEINTPQTTLFNQLSILSSPQLEMVSVQMVEKKDSQ